VAGSDDQIFSPRKLLKLAQITGAILKATSGLIKYFR